MLNGERVHITAKLEDIERGAKLKGIDPAGPVQVVNVQWYGQDVLS